MDSHIVILTTFSMKTYNYSMVIEELNKAKIWQLKYQPTNYNPKIIFEDSNTRFSAMFSLSFFLMIMSVEILFNQPFKYKIGIFHNTLYKKIFQKKYEKIERIETSSFAFSLFLILQKLFEEEESLKKKIEEIINYVICHWSNTLKLNEKQYNEKFRTLLSILDENKRIVLSNTYESRIDLIFSLYKSLEIGISDKKIIKKNISALIFSVSKAQKEFRHDVLKEFKIRFK